MSTIIDISSLLPYLKSTSNLALSSACFNRVVRSNGFPVKTSKAQISLANFSFYKSLNYPYLDEWSGRAVRRAIKNYETNQLLLLLQGGANVEAKNKYGHTPLMKATEYNITEYLQLLLQYKADVDAKDGCKRTGLMKTARDGQEDSLKLLLEAGADLEAKDDEGDTALDFAAIFGEINCMKLLLESGAQVSPTIRETYPQYAHLWGD